MMNEDKQMGKCFEKICVEIGKGNPDYAAQFMTGFLVRVREHMRQDVLALRRDVDDLAKLVNHLAEHEKTKASRIKG